MIDFFDLISILSDPKAKWPVDLQDWAGVKPGHNLALKAAATELQAGNLVAATPLVDRIFTSLSQHQSKKRYTP